MSEEHDKGYRLLFSFPQLVEQLIRLFVGGDWVTRLDFSTLEKFSERRVSNNLQRREKDLVWRLRYVPKDGDGSQGEWFYVYLHFEFQSEPDRFMALRMVTYTVLLYEELVRRNELTENGLLPPVLSLVLYNGRGRWHEALSLEELVEPLPGIPGKELPAGLTLLSYDLIDAQRYSPEELEAQRNAVAAFFQIEQSRGLEDVVHGAAKLKEVLTGEENRGLQQAALTWLLSRMEKLVGPGVTLPQIHEWTEVESMLEQSVLEWRDGWFREGLQEGRQEGRQEGEATILLHQLEKKFGSLSRLVRVQVQSASPEQLLEWAGRVLTAQTIDQVFGR